MVVTASRALAAHHRHCEALFKSAQHAAAAGNWAVLPAAVGTLREAVLEHFRYEEERLFPLYEETSGEEGATEPFCAEHDDMLLPWTALPPGFRKRRARGRGAGAVPRRTASRGRTRPSGLP